MQLEELLYQLLKQGFPKGEVKDEMFAFYNSMVGKSPYFVKQENPRTMCGSCINRVKASVFKYYHYDVAEKSGRLVFLNRYGINKIPLYGVDKKR